MKTDEVGKERELLADQDEPKNKDNQIWVYDSSVDHKGNLPLRASTGVWKSSLFIIGKQFCSFLFYYYYYSTPRNV